MARILTAFQRSPGFAPNDNGISDKVQAVIRKKIMKRSISALLNKAALLPKAVVPLAAVSAILAGSPAMAQSAPQGAIVIPDDVKIFGNDNPNVRKATAVVNGDVITGTDVDQRLALILAANQNKISDEEMKRLRLQVLRNLIDETLQIQEAKANDIEVAQAEIDQSYERVASQNFKQDISAMDSYLKRVGSSPASLKRQIQGELTWQRLLQRNVAPFINVSEDEVRETIDRMKASKGTDEYRIGEIYLSASPDARQQVYDNAAQIVKQIREGGSFVAYARQYSEASTAAVGGDLGWIRLAQLPGELANVAREMQPGQLVGPVEVPGGFDILYLIDKRQVLTADPRDAILALKQISIAFKPGTTEAQAGDKAEAFAKAISAAKGCGDVDDVAAAAGAQVVTNDQVRARDLPSQIQTAILQLSPGETLPPFGSLQEGVRILMLCGRDDPQSASGPNFDQLMAQMEDERINKRAQMYLRDLRRDAVIDYN